MVTLMPPLEIWLGIMPWSDSRVLSAGFSLSPPCELCDDSLPKWLSSQRDVSNLRVSSSCSKSSGFLVSASVLSGLGWRFNCEPEDTRTTLGFDRPFWCGTEALAATSTADGRLSTDFPSFSAACVRIGSPPSCWIVSEVFRGPCPSFIPSDILAPRGTAIYSTY